MAHRLIKQAVAAYLPAIQEVIARPAYSEVIYTLESVLKYKKTYQTVNLTYYVNGRYFTIPTRLYSSTAYWVDEMVATYINHPAVEAVEGRDAQYLTDSQIGWNGGAQSLAVSSGDFFMQATVNSSVQGVLVGIQGSGLPSGVFNSLEHAVLVSGSRVSIVESGNTVLDAVAFAGDLLITIQRIGSQITYQAGSLIDYVSTRPSTGSKAMSAVLYAGTDYVDDPSFGAPGLMSSRGDWAWGDGSGVYSLKVSSPWQWPGFASLNDGELSLIIDMDMRASDEDYSAVTLEMDEPIISKAAGFSEVDLAVATVDIPVVMQALGIDIDIGRSSMSFGSTMRASDYDYGEVALVMDEPSLTAISEELPEGEVNAADLVYVGDYYIVDPMAYVDVVESLSVGSGFELILGMSVDLADYLSLFDEIDVRQIILALLTNNIGLADSSLRSSRDVFDYIDSVTGLAGSYDFSGHTYATNIVSGAVGRYAGFDFDGFCRVGMNSYGIRSDGLYKLGSENDNGSAIGTRVDLSAEDFGSAQGKRVGNIFMGLSTDGKVYVRMTDDAKQEFIYRAYQRRDEYRADMGRGSKSRFWRLRLEVVDASRTELDNIEWVITSTGRRSS
jgi:hypothetical protein